MPDKQITMDVPYFQVPNEVFELGLNSFQLIVYIYLCRCGNHGKAAFPSYSTIARRCGISRRKAIDTITELEDMGLLRKIQRPKNNNDNDSNLYQVIIPSAPHALPSAQYALP